MTSSDKTREGKGPAKLKAGIPKDRVGRFDELTAILGPFCDAHLSAEYKTLCSEMAATLCRKRTLAMNGQSDTWAAGIVYALGKVNFLMDRTQEPHMTSAEIAKAIGVSVSAMQAKATTIRKALKLYPFDRKWSRPSKMDENPAIWMLQMSNGIIIDIRAAPHHLQVAAFEQGLIPYIPAERSAQTKDEVE